MKLLFFVTFAVYAAAVALEFTGTAFRKEKLLKAAWIVFLAAFALHTVFFVARGVAAKSRCPISLNSPTASPWARRCCRSSSAAAEKPTG